jgi:tetratricopeptide (TPR) repeat protein
MASQIRPLSPSQNSAPSQDDVRDLIPVRIAPLPHGEGARRMGVRLRQKFDSYDWRSDPNKPFERITYYQALLSRKLPLRDDVAVRMELGNEQLRTGRSGQAVETLEALVTLMNAHLDTVPRSIQAQIHQELALAYLRMGEQDNCIGMHNALSCNFPLHGAAVHQKKLGAEGAVREYTRVLELNPDSNLARWLLNIAYQQLGRYP